MKSRKQLTSLHPNATHGRAKSWAGLAVATLVLASLLPLSPMASSLGAMGAPVSPSPTAGLALAMKDDLTATQSSSERVAASAKLAGFPVTPVVAPQGDALSIIVATLSKASALQQAAFAGITAEDLKATKLAREEFERAYLTPGGAARTDWSAPAPALVKDLARFAPDAAKMWQALYVLAVGAEAVRDAVDQRAPAAATEDTVADTPWGRVMIEGGASCDDVYTGWWAFIYDSCGNDVYYSPAGGANLVESPECPSVIPFCAEICFILFGDACGTSVAVSVVIDTTGNDAVYNGPQILPALGGADWGGLALAWDDAGRDYRNVDGPALGGGSAGAYGLLVDDGADGDDYILGSYLPKIGGGFVNGAGLFFDLGGNDYYYHGWLSAGAGIVSANAFGLHVDYGGDDTYIDRDGWSQGSAAAGGVGWLLNFGGNDYYDTYGQVSQGAAVWNANPSSVWPGGFVDYDGTDVYWADYCETRGWAASSLAVLFDLGAAWDYYYLACAPVNNAVGLNGFAGWRVDT